LLRNAQKSPEYQEIEITVLIGVRSSAKGILTQSHIPSLEKNSVKWMEDHDLTFCGKVLSGSVSSIQEHAKNGVKADGP